MSGMIYGDNAKYDEILGVSKNASLVDLARAYIEAAKKYHPDEGGDPEKLKELVQAYGVLLTEKRETFRSLKVSLTDLYNGTSKKENFSREVICSKCKGKGSKSGASIVTCSGCLGSGMVPFTDHFLPLRRCYQCKGTGETLSKTMSKEDRCEQCKGRKIVLEKTVLEVRVEKGMRNRQKITFPAEEVFHRVRGGRVVVILKQEEHPKFKRKGDDLFVEHTLSLTEAMSGCFQFGLTHLDNRKLIIKSQPGEVVKSGQFKEINDEGMPMYQRPFMRGKLYIHFTVDQSEAIEAVLPPGPSPQLADMEVDEGEGEETTLHDANQQQAQEAYDEMMKMKDMTGEGAMRKRKTTLHDANQQQEQEAYDMMPHFKKLNLN